MASDLALRPSVTMSVQGGARALPTSGAGEYFGMQMKRAAFNGTEMRVLESGLL